MYQELYNQHREQHSLLREILFRLEQLTADLAVQKQVLYALANQTAGILAAESEILAAVTAPPPVAFVLQEVVTMAKAGAFGKLKVTITDTGSAIVTAVAVDEAGFPTSLPAGSSTPAWSSNNPGVVVTPLASDPTGLTATITPATPPVLVTGAQVSVSATLPGATAPITGSTPADINVVAGGPTGFQVTEGPGS
jgi:hypothetical protein